MRNNFYKYIKVWQIIKTLLCKYFTYSYKKKIHFSNHLILKISPGARRGPVCKNLSPNFDT